MPARPEIVLFVALAMGSVAGGQEPRVLAALPDASTHPGALAWSADGTRLAVIRGPKLLILDWAKGSTETIEGLTPSHVDWAPSSDVLVVDRGVKLVRVASNGLHEVPLPCEPEAELVAARWWTKEQAIAICAKQTSTSIGLQVRASMKRGTEAEPLYVWDTMLPVRGPLDLKSWAWAGTNPVDRRLLFAEYHDPPALPPSLRYKTRDVASTEASELFQLEGRALEGRGSWSPNGRRIALTDPEGSLLLYSLDDDEMGRPPLERVRGLYPAWNPHGSQIFLGGWVITPPNEPRAPLVTSGPQTVGVWSPDGTRLAVTGDDGLQVLGPFVPELVPPDAPGDGERTAKLRLLEELLTEGLIETDEYQKRRKDLLSGARP